MSDRRATTAPDETELPPPEPEDAKELSIEQSQPYHLHIILPAEMRQTLRDCAELAYKMRDIPKPDIVDLMNLFIGWGIEIQKRKWLERMGYR